MSVCFKGPLAILDPAIQTLEIECTTTTTTIGNADDERCTNVVVSIQAQIECGGASCQTLIKNQQKNTTSIVLTVTSDWEEVWTLDVVLEEDDDDTAEYYSRGTTWDVQSLPITVQNPSKVHLWWPNGLSSVADDEDYDAVDAISTRGAYLHSFRFDITIIDHQEIPIMREVKQKRKLDASNTNTTDITTTHRRSSLVSDSTTIRTGIRTIDTYLDEVTQGQVFKVNRQPIYIVGGNWITTDSAFRYSASKKRYCDELELLRYAGFNLVRVWGTYTLMLRLFWLVTCLVKPSRCSLTLLLCFLFLYVYFICLDCL